MPSYRIALWLDTRFRSRHTEAIASQNIKAAKHRAWVSVCPSFIHTRHLVSLQSLSCVYSLLRTVLGLSIALLFANYFILISISIVFKSSVHLLSYFMFFFSLKSRSYIIEGKESILMLYKKSQLPNYVLVLKVSQCLH